MQVTRKDEVIHCAVTQGPGLGGTKGQPATTHGAPKVVTDIPITVTEGEGTVGIACPP